MLFYSLAHLHSVKRVLLFTVQQVSDIYGMLGITFQSVLRFLFSFTSMSRFDLRHICIFLAARYVRINLVYCVWMYSKVSNRSLFVFWFVGGLEPMTAAGAIIMARHKIQSSRAHSELLRVTIFVCSFLYIHFSFFFSLNCIFNSKFRYKVKDSVA